MKHRLSLGTLAVFVIVCSISRAEPQAPWQGLNSIVNLLGKLDDPAAQADVLRGVLGALKGRRQVPMPQEWRAIYARLQASPSVEVRDEATSLALMFGDADAIAALRHRAADSKADPVDRLKSIDALAGAHDIETGKMLLTLLDDASVRASAIRNLAGYSDPATPDAILNHYEKLNESERRDAINTLASRAAWAAPMLDAVEKGRIPHADVSAFTVRQLGGLHDHAIDDRLKKFYGTVRPPAKDKAKLIATYKKTFTPDMLAKADLSHGRAVFSKTCAVCHTLFDAGGKVGPELTGSQRANLDYVLENVVDPSAVVAKDYYMTVVETNDGRTIVGIIKGETDATLTLREATQETTVPKNEIKTRRTSAVSLMPEGLLEALSLSDARDLIAYLGSPVQAPLK